MMDEKQFADEIASIISAAVDKATSPLLSRIAEMEQQLKAVPAPEKGEKGDKGDPGAPGVKKT